jgi:hypothetical protein
MTSRPIQHFAKPDTDRIRSAARRAGRGAASLAAGLLGLGLAVGVVTPLTGLMAPTEASAQERDADYSQFYDQLEEHGRWMEHPRWGYVWLPNADDGNWRPYTVGHWVNTEEHGWYWNSDEPWGWATYHYGRWVREDEEGWIWIPGREWAPAWVAWRESDEYIGWAPLPPEAAWEPGRGELSFASSYYDSPRFDPFWIFVRPMHMVQPGLHRHILPRSRAPYILRNTNYVTNYSFVDRRVYNRGIRVNLVERSLNRSLPPVRIVSTDNHRDHGFRPHGGEHRGEHRSGPSAGQVAVGVAAGVVALGVINVFRPKLAPKVAGGPPPAPRNFVPPASRGPEGRPSARPVFGAPGGGQPRPAPMPQAQPPAARPVVAPPSPPPVVQRPPGPSIMQQPAARPVVAPPSAPPAVQRPPGPSIMQQPAARPVVAPPSAPPVVQRPPGPSILQPPPAARPAVAPPSPPPQRAVQPGQQQQPAAQPRPQPPAGAAPQQKQGQGQGGQKRNPNDPNQPPPPR